MRNYTVLIAVVAAFGGLLFGFDTAVIAGTLQSLRGYFHLSDTMMGLIVASAAIGSIPGALLSGRLADRYGRKKIMLITAILYIIAAGGSGIAASITELITYRLIGGVAIGLASALSPVYISEISSPRYRGRLGMLQQLAIVMGILLSFVSNYLIDGIEVGSIPHWRLMLGAAVVPSVIFLFLLVFIPESPRWLLVRGRTNKTMRGLNKLFDKNEVADLLAMAANAPQHETGPSLQEVFAPRYRKVVFIGIVFASIAHLTGINIIFYYAPLIFERTQMGGSELFQTMLTGIANLLFTVLAFGLIDRVGRKKLLLAGSGVMSGCMLLVAWLFYKDYLGNYFVLAAVFIYIGGFACTWGAVLWVYIAEMFPDRIRGRATSIAAFGNWIMNSVISFTFPLMLAQLGPASTFLLYAVFNAGMIWFVSRYIFETKGVPLERVEELYHTI